MNIICNFDVQTCGTGLHSFKAQNVRVVELELDDIIVVDMESRIASLIVHFDQDTWNVEKDGLVYTDPTFLSQLKTHLAASGIVGDIEYSEKGRQTNSIIDFDVDDEFIDSFIGYVNIKNR